MATTEIPTWVKNRILGFFNHARQVSDILDGTIKDDPTDGAGSTIGPTLAARILRVRNELPTRKFTSLQQIDDVRGVGPGMMKDFVYSFSISADEAFLASMYDSGTIYKTNWPLEYFRTTFDKADDFNELASDNEKLRRFIMGKVDEVCRQRRVPTAEWQKMVSVLSACYIDDYTNSTSTAGYAFALWFYEFDADNWFSWEQIQGQTLSYFEYNMNTYPWMMDLHFFKGFENLGIIEPGICPPDLPVVVNHAEQAITFWIAALYD